MKTCRTCAYWKDAIAGWGVCSLYSIDNCNVAEAPGVEVSVDFPGIEDAEDISIKTNVREDGFCHNHRSKLR